MDTAFRGVCSPGIWRLEQRIPVVPKLRLFVRVNIYVLEVEHGLCLIDCGAPTGYEGLRSTLQKEFPGKPVKRVYLTHGHFDHAGAGVAFLNSGAEVWGTEAERPLTETGGPVGVPETFRYPAFLPSHVLGAEHEIVLSSGQRMVTVLSPGHTGGSVSFASPDSQVLALGDCLFGPTVGYATTFFLEFMTAFRQPSSERRQHLETLTRLRTHAMPPGLLLPGHGKPVETGERHKSFSRTERILRFTLRVKR